MHTEVTETGRFERTLTIQLDESELEAAKTKAARKISQQMKIKGFRPGKAPRTVVERMVGPDHLRSEAIEEAIPDTVGAAIDESGLDPATIPSVTAIRDREEGGVEVDVLVTLWPTLEFIPDFEGRKVQIDPPVATPEEIEHQINALRNQFADLEDVDRPAAEGDFVTINVTAHDGDGEIEDASANDLLYEIGSQSFYRGLDGLLVGSSAGDIVEGGGTLPAGLAGDGDRDVTLKALVKDVKAKVLPELTDEFVDDVTEFDTVAEMREALETNIRAYKAHTARSVFSDRAIEELVADVDLELPKALVDAETEARIRNLLTRLESDNISFDDYLRITGQDQAAFVEGVREQAGSALSTRIVVESIIAIEGMSVDDDEYREAVEAIAASSESTVDEVEKLLAAHGQAESLTDDILRRKALERIAGAAIPVDAEGNTVDLAPMAPGADDEAEEPNGDDAQDEESSPATEE